MPPIILMGYHQSRWGYQSQNEVDMVINLYGLLNAARTQKGLINRNPGNNMRQFVLTRSFFAGVQRYAWSWSGDNTASWEHFSVSIPMGLASGICGMPFNGADVGGFLKISR